MYNYRDIKKIHLEVTQRCQAACPMCDRNENGGKDNVHLTGAELSLEDCKKIFTPDFVKQLNVMYMCGNLGDPIVAKDTLEIFKYFREHNPSIWLSMNTNAGAKSTEWWRELAKIYGKNGTVIFSIDGLEDTNHIYRQNVNWKVVEQSFRAFIGAGGRARWDYIIFEHNQHQVEEAEQLAKDWGFEKFTTKKTGRFITTDAEKKDHHKAVARNGNVKLLKKPDEKFQNNSLKKQDQLVQKYGSMADYLDAAKIICKVKDEGNLFITAEGLAMPCCWTAGRMYKWWHADPKIEQIWQFIDAAGGKTALDAKVNGLENIFGTGLFEKIEESWSKESIAGGKLKVCAMKCGAEFDPFKDQWEN